MTIERRSLVAQPELRAEADSKVAKGYAALFNTKTDIGGYFMEVIAPGAFSETLKTSDVRALHSHDRGRILGRQSAGTLRLTEDAKGLAIEIDLPDTTDGRDLAVSLERGDITGMSFGFRVTHDEWDETSNPPTRTIHACELIEVSPLAFPQYDDTEIALRGLEEARKDRQRQHHTSGYLLRKAEMESKFRGLPGE